MQAIGLFYGTRTGETLEVAELIAEAFRGFSNTFTIHLHDVGDARIADLHQYEYLILGTSTYKTGDLEPDWEYFHHTFKNQDFSGKKMAFFGLGNSLEYADTFASGMGILARFARQSNAGLIGIWPNAGYEYDYSYSEYDEQYFYGLVLDQDYEAEMTETRVEEWVQQLIKEIDTFEERENAT